MSEVPVFERNMLAIASIHGPMCAHRIRSARADSRVGIAGSRDGLPVPFLERDGRTSYMHSRTDPQREAERLAKEYPKHGFYAFLGLGAGYTIAALLAAQRVSRGIIIEYDAPILRAVLESIDLTHILADRRLLLLVDPDDDELNKAIIDQYIPVVTGDFSSVPLRGRTDLAPASYKKAAETIMATMGGISDDYSVQSFFGKRWFSNIIKNLEAAAYPTPPVGPVREAMVTAAGPSLELYMDLIRNRSKNTFLIATDTSLRALLARDIVPDAVISIDCQHISYYHFSLGMPPGVPLFLDLASPPTVTRMAARPYFFSSGHPLARYVASRFRAFPILDTSGGNVTHAAVSLAEYLGASIVRIYGADFSYPFGKTYARGTYIYPYFDIRQSRLQPLESLFSQFLFRNHSMDRQEDGDGTFRYITKPLIAYRERLERLSGTATCTLERVRGYGAEAVMADKVPPSGTTHGKVFAAGKTYLKPREFLASYAVELESVAVPDRNAAAYLDGLGARDKDLWTTILPSAAAIKREWTGTPPEPHELLTRTREWCLEEVRSRLSAD